MTASGFAKYFSVPTLLLTVSYECTTVASWDGGSKLGWVRTVSHLCCKTCNGTVVPANTVISSSSLEDSCLTVRSLVCRVRPGGVKYETVRLSDQQDYLPLAFIEQEFSYRACCHDHSRKMETYPSHYSLSS